MESILKLKRSLVTPPFPAYPDFDKPFMVKTDASKLCFGGVFAQKGEEEKVHPIRYVSRTIKQAEKHCHACEREALTVVFSLRQFRVY